MGHEVEGIAPLFWPDPWAARLSPDHTVNDPRPADDLVSATLAVIRQLLIPEALFINALCMHFGEYCGSRKTGGRDKAGHVEPIRQLEYPVVGLDGSLTFGADSGSYTLPILSQRTFRMYRSGLLGYGAPVALTQ